VCFEFDTARFPPGPELRVGLALAPGAAAAITLVGVLVVRLVGVDDTAAGPRGEDHLRPRGHVEHLGVKVVRDGGMRRQHEQLNERER
jgi:hypothetical protein